MKFFQIGVLLVVSLCRAQSDSSQSSELSTAENKNLEKVGVKKSPDNNSSESSN